MAQVPSLEPDDTQKLSSQVIKDYYLNRSAAHNQDSLPQTLTAGDPGYTNLSQNFSAVSQQQETGEDGGPGGSDIDGDELATRSPRTPAVAGFKRDRHGNVLSSAQTPGSGLAAMFKTANGGMNRIGLSQIFNNTQQASSPNANRTTPLSQRPSPPINATYSPEAPPTSSPVLPRRYVPLDESQQQRRQLQNARLRTSSMKAEGAFDSSFSDEEDDPVQQRYAKERRMEQQYKGARRGFDKLLPGYHYSRPSCKSSTSVVNLITPASNSRHTGFEKTAELTPGLPDRRADNESDYDEYDELNGDVVPQSEDNTTRTNGGVSSPLIPSHGFSQISPATSQSDENALTQSPFPPRPGCLPEISNEDSQDWPNRIKSPLLPNDTKIPTATLDSDEVVLATSPSFPSGIAVNYAEDPVLSQEIVTDSMEQPPSVPTNSNREMDFVTAPTHQSLSPKKVDPSQRLTQTSSQRLYRGQKLGDIAAEPSPPQASVTSVDLRTFGLMDGDDDAYQAAVLRSSPPRTRQRMRNEQSQAIHEPEKGAISLSALTSHNKSNEDIDIFDDEPVDRKRRRTRGTLAPSSLKKKKNAALQNIPSNISKSGVSSSSFIEKALPERLASATSIPHQPAIEDALHQVSASALPATMPSLSVPNASISSRAVPLVPRRVLALFNNRRQAHYPATCLGKSDDDRYKIRFDDENLDDVKDFNVRNLDLKPGDVIRIDKPGERTNQYVVCSTKDRISDDRLTKEEYPTTDVYGNETVVVTLKSRDSLPGAADTPTVEFPIASIYVTQGPAWDQFRGRPFEIEPDPLGRKRVQTPSNQPSRVNTPQSRRRTLLYPLGDAQKSSAGGTKHTGLFSNMAFVVTYSEDAEEGKSKVGAVIVKNGGTVLQKGFEELFEPLLSPSPRQRSKTAPKMNSGSTSRLTTTSNAQMIGFTAVIADAYSRRPKHMQALALNLPCLSGRWIMDCIARKTLLPWERYLLPAGESASLDNQVRSRTFNGPNSFVPAASARFTDMIETRPSFFTGCDVLMVKAKKTDEAMELFRFLCHAVGADSVEFVAKTSDKATSAKNGAGSSRVLEITHESIIQSLILGEMVDA